jgi:hypothetical protein
MSYPVAAPTAPIPVIRPAAVNELAGRHVYGGPVRRTPVEVFGLIVCVFLLLGAGVVLALGAVALVLGGVL